MSLEKVRKNALYLESMKQLKAGKARVLDN